MHPALSTFADYVVKYRDALFLLAPPLYVVLTAVAALYTPTHHSLLVTAISWLIIWVPTVFWVGIYSNSSRPQRKAAWLAGALLALSAVCDRAACDKHGIWATKALLLFLTNFFADNELLAKRLALPTYTVPDDHAHVAEKKLPVDASGHIDQPGTLLVLTVCASCALGVYTIPTTFMLGLCSAIFAAVGLVTFRSIIVAAAPDEGEDNKRRLMAGTVDLRASISGVQKAQRLAALRDVAVAIAIVCGIASILMESSVSASNITWEPVYRDYKREWREVHNFRILQCFLWMLPVTAFLNLLTFIMLYLIGAGHLTLVTVFSLLGTKMFSAPSSSFMFFMVIFDSTALIYVSEKRFRETGETRRFRGLRIITFLATAVAVGGLLVGRYNASQAKPVGSDGFFVPSDVVSDPSLDPIPIDMSKGHPAAQLMDAAEADFQKLLNRQSKSLAEAVAEYRRRYGIPPPPHFDKWYEFATRNGVVMVDEYDMINEMLLPFWALKPATIRSRVANALGHEDSSLLAVAIRHGAVENYQNGEEWQQQATVGMMKQFVQYLPDMDLGFNLHDEPRVVVPNNLLSSMVAKARNEVLPRSAKNASPRNGFSAHPADLNDGTRFVESSTTKFNRFAHQQTWTHSRLSCPADSQAQTFEDDVADNRKVYAASDLGFVYNMTAFSDICNSPSLSSTYGFFERPNAFNIIHELTPVFSQSKISSFQDILYPSPWYWMGKVGYDETRDTTWENKTNSLYWRGSTTGGFSRNGGWRRQHRQHIVRRLNAPDTAQILEPVRGPSKAGDTINNYTIAEVDRRALKNLIDVQFSHIGQCDPGDCDAQQEFFKVTKRVDGQDAWYYKHLLDMDGNAFSGRFYSFLKSKSLTYKMALFREWHAEWLKPWVHYVPLSLRGDEHLDLVRWFSGTKVSDKDGDGKLDYSDADGGKVGGNGDSEGEKRARRIAKRSTEWHDKVLRNVDFEAWFFRLLLEYGRVVDDKREEIGFPGP
ncbi:glycosyltransferase family 90 protein [Bipolaris maydis ATCC 48331]|uniref:Glycosyltransferase family 90 protein n=1 Tax=Cochliobolus heterostrophus (strain C4 / ATCC 48331 / race T) TaxID=665024 RepID=N4XSF9_COCH4|nr:glycosyltransferase family 90 protein [Bipolaris maydis ATCC 48331]ENI09306.1 glycosyltransferase family 90 protein [Bipolaris maydis ATCC 48331]KAJ5023694.1 glycosyltransferase [Bipolaris maydis]KAJ6269100.1 glycosyltransferase [Bipolaris maydis]